MDLGYISANSFQTCFIVGMTMNIFYNYIPMTYHYNDIL